MSTATEQQQEQQEKFHFPFMGSEYQLNYFVKQVKKRLPEVQIKAYFDEKTGDYICTIEKDYENCFLVGSILTACYSAFNEQHNTNKHEHNP